MGLQCSAGVLQMGDRVSLSLPLSLPPPPAPLHSSEPPTPPTPPHPQVGLGIGLNPSGAATTNMIKCGCSHDSFDVWAARVLGLGLSVGRVEEMGRGEGGGGLVSRKLVR